MNIRTMIIFGSLLLSACSSTPVNYDSGRLQRQYENLEFIREAYLVREKYFEPQLKGIRLNVPTQAQKLAEQFVSQLGTVVNRKGKMTLVLTYKTMTRTEAQLALYAAGHSPVDAANATSVESSKWGRAVVVESRLIEDDGDVFVIGLGAAGYLTNFPKDEKCGGFTVYCSNVLYGAIASASQEAMRSMN